MEFLFAAIVLFAIAFIAIPILIWVLKGAGKIARIIIEIAIALLIIGGIVFLIIHFAM